MMATYRQWRGPDPCLSRATASRQAFWPRVRLELAAKRLIVVSLAVIQRAESRAIGKGRLPTEAVRKRSR